MNYFCTVEEAILEIKKGKMLILLDSPDRENEGDLYIPADSVSPKIITAMIRFGGGLICCAITRGQAAQLELSLMVDPLENKEETHVNFTVSVNSKKGISTGVSAYDRAKTIKVLTGPGSTPRDIVKPGHVFGLVAKEEGVLERGGHTEAAVDLARLSNLNPAGVLCEILSSNGRVANLNSLKKISQKLNIRILSINSLVDYLKKHPLPKLPIHTEAVRRAWAYLPTRFGKFKIFVYQSLNDGREHVVLLKGAIRQPMMVRVHSLCLTGDTLFSQRCDCGGQLRGSMKLISRNNSGAIVYLNQEGRGVGLVNKIKSYLLQDLGQDTVEANHSLGLPADARGYKLAADILKDLKIYQVNLLTNNPDKENQLILEGIDVVKTTPLETKPNKINYRYLNTKKRKLSHKLSLV